MKLTNYQRDAFVSAAMNDVPKKDYDTPMRATALKVVLAALPEHVRKAFQSKDGKEYIETVSRDFGKGHGHSIEVPGRYSYQASGYIPKLTADAAKEVTDIIEALDAQEETRKALATKLKAAAYACTTLKALQETLPEFIKYMPTEADKAVPGTSLAVINPAAEFAAAGWPARSKKIAA